MPTQEIDVEMTGMPIAIGSIALLSVPALKRMEQMEAWARLS